MSDSEFWNEFDNPPAKPAATSSMWDEFDKAQQKESGFFGGIKDTFSKAADIYSDPNGGALPALGKVMVDALPLNTNAEGDKTGNAYELGRQVFIRGPVQLAEMLGKAGQAFTGGEIGGDLRRSAEELDAKLTPNMEERGSIASALIRGAPAVVPSLAAAVPYIVAPEIGIPAGIAMLLGDIGTIAVFGGSAATDTMEKLAKVNPNNGDVVKGGLISGFAQGVLEAVQNRLALPVLGAGARALKASMQGLIGDTAETGVIKPLAVAYAKAMVGEPLTEDIQDSITELAERHYGAKPTDLWEIIKDSTTATMGMVTLTAPFGIVGHYQNSQRAEAINSVLSDPSQPKEARQAVVGMLYQQGKEAKVKDADQWFAGAKQDIEAGLPIRRDSLGNADPAQADAAMADAVKKVLSGNINPVAPTSIIPDQITPMMQGASIVEQEAPSHTIPDAAIMGAPDIDTAIALATTSLNTASVTPSITGLISSITAQEPTHGTETAQAVPAETQQQAPAVPAEAVVQSPPTPLPASAPKADVLTPVLQAGTIKVLSDGRYAAVGFTPEQIKVADPKAFIDGKGTGIFPAKTNKIQLERALGISTIQEGTILAEGDKPFGKRKQAAMVIATTKGMSKTHKVIPLDDGGYGIAPRIADTKGEVERTGESIMHKEAGEPAEAATPAVIVTSLAKGDANTKLTLAQMKTRLLGEVDAAITSVKPNPEHVEYIGLRSKGEPNARDFSKTWIYQQASNDYKQRINFLRDAIGYVTFDVPGDGVFKVLNTPENLESFRSKIGGAFKAVPKQHAETRAPLDRPAQDMKPDAYVRSVMSDNKATAEDFKNAIEVAGMHNIDTEALETRRGELSVMEAEAEKLDLDTFGMTHKQIANAIANPSEARKTSESEALKSSKPAETSGENAGNVKSEQQLAAENKPEEILVKQPYNVNTMAGIDEFEQAREAAASAPKNTIVRVRIDKEGLYEHDPVKTLYGAFVANGDGTATWAQATFPASKENPTDAQIMELAEADRLRNKETEAKIAEQGRKNKAALADKGIIVGLELQSPSTYVPGKKGITTFTRAKVVAIDEHGIAEVHATLKGSGKTYVFKADADSRLFEKLAEQTETAQAKKLEVLKAQAQGKISGDQGAALKELADAGEHAAVDEVLKPASNELDKVSQKFWKGETFQELKAEQATGEGAPIADFGQKIEGARKDLAAAMKKEYSDDDLASLPLSKIWPADLHEKIEDPFIAAIAFAARQELPSKPRVSYKVKNWVEKVKALRSLATMMLASETTRARAEALLNESAGLKGFAAKVHLLEALDREQWNRIGEVGEFPNAYRYEPDGENKSKQVPSPTVKVQIDGRTEYYPGAKSVADVIEKVNEKLGVAKTEAKMKFEVRGRGDSYFINKAGDSEYRKLKTFTTSKEALDYRNANYDELVKAWEAVKERDNVKETDVRGAENRPRTAANHRENLSKLNSVVQGLINRSDITANTFSDALIAHAGGSKLPSYFDVPLETMPTPASPNNMDSTLNKLPAYRLSVFSKALGNLNDADALTVKGFSNLDIPAKRFVQSAMLAIGHDAKVRGSVIKLIPVDVMNDLAKTKFSADGLFSDQAMLSDGLAVSGKIPVRSADPAVLSFVRAVAGVTAKIPFTNDASRIALKDDPAIRAGQFDSILSKSFLPGHDVTPQDFADEFSFFGVQFGNYVENKQRQQAINEAYDAFMDLADILNIPPKAISLNGELGVAFGARGSGSASAHYESDNLVINLTKTRGAGTLAHEWFHALDNYFQRSRNAPMDHTRETRFITYKPEPMFVRKDGKGTAMIRAQLNALQKSRPDVAIYDQQYWKPDPNHPQGVRPEVEEKFAGLVQALNESPMKARASMIDKGASEGYWSRIIERAARSFENYVIAKMAEKGYNNDYLANVVDIANFKRDEGRYPYLKQEELAPVVEAFDNLFGEMQTKETDKGTALYSTSSDLDHQVHLLQDKYDITRDGARQMYEAGDRIDANGNKYTQALYSTRQAAISPAIESAMIEAYNADLPSQEEQLRDAMKNNYWPEGWEYRTETVSNLEDMYGDDRADWPKELVAALGDGNEVVTVAEGGNFEYYAPKDAPSEAEFNDRVADEIGVIPPATSLDEMLDESRLNGFRGESATSEAFKAMAKAEGWNADERGTRYFDIWKDNTDPKTKEDNPTITLHVRISDHSKTAGFSRPDRANDIHINIAPSNGRGNEYHGADTFESALWTMRNASLDADGNVLVAGKEAGTFSVSEKPVEGMSVSRVHQATLKLRAKWFGFRKINIVQSVKDLPAGVGGLQSAAWHGSPHDYEAFSMDKVGTGEGAQAYGHGLYFAGSRDVAEFYKHKLSGLSFERKGERLSPANWAPTSTPEEQADAYAVGRLLSALKGINVKHLDSHSIAASATSLARGAENDARLYNDPAANKRESMIAERLHQFAADAKSGVLKATQGKLYQVELAPAEEDYLLWDKPLSEQSEKVRGALKYAAEKFESLTKEANALDDKPENDIAYESLMQERRKYAGFKDIQKRQDKYDGNAIYNLLSGGNRESKETSDLLHSIGIRGIKYLDGSSRSKGEGNYNYVIFSDKDVSITQKFSTSINAKTEAIYDPRTNSVYLIADNIATPERAVWVAVHETSHAGLRMIDRTVAESLDKLAKNSSVSKLAAAIAKDRAWMYGKEGMPQSESVEEAFAELSSAIETDNLDALLTRYGVKMHPAFRNGLVGAVNRVIEAIRNFIAKVMGRPVTEVTDAEVRGLIAEARGAIEGKATASELRAKVLGEGMPLFSKSSQPFKNQHIRESYSVLNDPGEQEAQEVQGGIEGKSAVDAAEFIASNSPDASHRLIASKVAIRLRELESAGAEFTMNVSHVGGEIPDTMLGAGVRGQVFRKPRDNVTHIWVNGSDVMGAVGVSYETVLHELLHATTQSILNLGEYGYPGEVGDTYNELLSVYKHISKLIEKKNSEGATLNDFEDHFFNRKNNTLENVHELISWGLSNKETQAYLESIPYKNTTVWGGFVSAIRKMLGLPEHSETALSEVLRIADKLLTIDVPNLLIESISKGRYMRINYARSDEYGNRAIYNSSKSVQQPIPGTAQPSLPEETRTEATQRLWQDSAIRFKKIEETLQIAAAKEAGYKGDNINEAVDYMKARNVVNPISDSTDVYQAIGLVSGKASEKMQDFEERQIQPLVKEAAQSGISMADIDEFLRAQHAPESNRQNQRIQGNDQSVAFGMSDAEAARVMAEFKARPNFSKLESIANKWQALTGETLNLREDAGVIAKGQADAYRATYQHYVPVKGVEEESLTKPKKGAGINAKDKRRMGHGLRDERIIENIMRDRVRAINQIEQNEVRKVAHNFLKEANSPEIGTVGRPVKHQVFMPGAKHYMVMYHGSDVQSFDNLNDARAFVQEESSKYDRNLKDYYIDREADEGRVIRRAKPMPEEHEFEVMIDGVSYRDQFNDPLLARAFNNLGMEQVNKLLEGARKINVYLSKVYTAYSPTFLLKNPIRDAIQGAITNTSKFGIGTAAKIFKEYPHAMRELSRHLKEHGASAEVNRFRKNGAVIGAAYVSDIERIGEDVMDAYNEYAGASNTYHRVYAEQIAKGKSEKIARTMALMKAGKAGFLHTPIIGHFLRFMEHVNAVTENALRLATFNTLIKEVDANGKRVYTDSQAAFHAKNLMNFNRKGELTVQAGALYLFFNPNAQGSEVLASALTTSKYHNQARALAGTMVLSAFMLAEMMRGGDDDDEKKWKKIPSALKDKNMIFGFGDTKIMLPIPYGYGVFHALGNALSDAMHGENTWKLGVHLTASVFENFSPVGNPVDGEHGVYQFLPTIPKMAMAPSVNENAFGTPIMPDKFGQNKPDSATMYRNTKGTLYSGIAGGMNTLTGGDKYQSGLVDVSPETLKFWMSSLTGGAGQFALDSINAGLIGLQGETPTLKETPIIKSFTHEIGVGDARSAYWKEASRASEALDAFRAAKKAHDVMSAQQMMKDDAPLIRLGKLVEHNQKRIKQLRDSQDAIRMNDSISLEQKRAQMKLMEKRETEIYDRFLAVIKQ